MAVTGVSSKTTPTASTYSANSTSYIGYSSKTSSSTSINTSSKTSSTTSSNTSSRTSSNTSSNTTSNRTSSMTSSNTSNPVTDCGKFMLKVSDAFGLELLCASSLYSAYESMQKGLGTDKANLKFAQAIAGSCYSGSTWDSFSGMKDSAKDIFVKYGK